MAKKKKNSKAFEKKLTVFLHTIGDNLYALRVARKETLKAIAKAVKMAPARLSKIEKGLCPNYRFGILIRLCKHYKVSVLDVVIKGKFTAKKVINIAPKSLTTSLSYNIHATPALHTHGYTITYQCRRHYIHMGYSLPVIMSYTWDTNGYTMSRSISLTCLLRILLYILQTSN